MTIPERTVTVKQIPQSMSDSQGRIFLREIESSMEAHRPRMVLDCSNLPQLDMPVIHLLLSCLEEAMKRNGDIKLAALPPGAGAVLKQTGVGRLFDIYETTAEAVDSFYRLPTNMAPPVFAPAPARHEPENAA